MNNFIEICPHAMQRIGQRGIKLNAIDAILDYGKRYFVSGGRAVFWLNKRAVQEAFEREGVRLDQHLNKVVILENGSLVITVYRTNHREKSWKGQN